MPPISCPLRGHVMTLFTPCVAVRTREQTLSGGAKPGVTEPVRVLVDAVHPPVYEATKLMSLFLMVAGRCVAAPAYSLVVGGLFVSAACSWFGGALQQLQAMLQ